MVGNLGIMFGLASALSYGLLDICSALVARYMTSLWALALAHLISAFCVMEVLMGASLFEHPLVSGAMLLNPQVWLMGVVLGTCNAVANVCLYQAFATGKLAILSPLVSAYGLVPMLLSVLVNHETMTGVCEVAGGLLVVGMVLIAIPATPTSTGEDPWSYEAAMRARRQDARALAWGGGALLGFGIETYLMSYSMAAFGPVAPLVFSRMTSTSLLFGCIFALRRWRFGKRLGSQEAQMEEGPQRPVAALWWRWPIIGLMSGADVCAALSFSAGTQLIPLCELSLLSLSYPLFPLLFGLVVYRERLLGRQWWGMALLLVGLTGLALSQGDAPPELLEGVTYAVALYGPRLLSAVELWAILPTGYALSALLLQTIISSLSRTVSQRFHGTVLLPHLSSFAPVFQDNYLFWGTRVHGRAVDRRSEQQKGQVCTPVGAGIIVRVPPYKVRPVRLIQLEPDWEGKRSCSLAPGA